MTRLVLHSLALLVWLVVLFAGLALLLDGRTLRVATYVSAIAVLVHSAWRARRRAA